MKKIFDRKKIAALIVLAVALGFGAIGLIATLPTIIFNGNRQKVLELGGAAARAYNIKMFEATTFLNEEYYYLTYEYDDEELYHHKGKTAASYTQEEAIKIVYSGSLEIIYNEKGSVEKGFDKVAANRSPKIVLLILLGVAVAAGGLGVGMLARSPKPSALVARFGVETDGTVIGTVTDVKVQGKSFYSVKVSYKNQRGEYADGQTEYVYESEDAARFSKGRTVRIKYYGPSVVILGENAEDGGES